MKRLHLCLIISLLSLSPCVLGQEICGYVQNGYIYELYEHEQARNNNAAHCFNHTFIKSFLGLPPDSMWKYEHQYKKKVTDKYGKTREYYTLEWNPVSAPRGLPFVFNGKSYDYFYSYTSSIWKPEFITLQEIKDRSCGKHVSDWKFYVLFDDVFLPDDLISYRFDKDYIDSVVVYHGKRHSGKTDAEPEYWFTYDPLRDTCRVDEQETWNDAFILRIFSTDYSKNHAHNAQDSLHTALPRLRTQFEEDANRSAIFLNGTFVGSTFGLNLDSLTRIEGKNPYRVTVTQEPYEAGDVRYTSRTYIECKHYKPELVPLTSLVEKFPSLSHMDEKLAVYTVDNMLMPNPQNVLIDKDYISVVRGFRGEEIECLPPLKSYERHYKIHTTGVIQVYVKKAEYLYDLAHPRII